MKDTLVELLIFGLILAAAAIPALDAYAIISTCGLEGLFVDCRIAENK